MGSPSLFGKTKSIIYDNLCFFFRKIDVYFYGLFAHYNSVVENCLTYGYYNEYFPEKLRFSIVFIIIKRNAICEVVNVSTCLILPEMRELRNVRKERTFTYG